MRDLRLECQLVVNAGTGTVELRIINGRDVYLCRLPAGAGAGEEGHFAVTGPAAGDGDGIIAKIPGARIESRRETRVELYLADRWLVLRLDGEIVAEAALEGDRGGRYSHSMRTTVGIRCEGVGVHVAGVRVFRDLHYTWLGRPTRYACVSRTLQQAVLC